MPQAVETSKYGDHQVESSTFHAIVAIARRLGLEVSYQELRRNYSLPSGEPDTRAIIAIARDIGMEARAVATKFRNLPQLSKTLPAIIRVNDGAALILESARIDPGAGAIAILSDPMVNNGNLTPVDEATLKSIWHGEVILFKRKHALTAESQPFGMAWLLGQVLRERKIFVDIALGAVVSTIFSLAPPFVFLIVVNRVLVNHSMSTLQVLVGAIVLMIVFESMLGFLRRRLIEVATVRIDSRLNLYVMDKLLRLPMDYFERNPTGRTMTKLSRLWQIRNFLTGQLFGSILDVVPLIGLIPVLFLINWQLASLVVVLASIVFAIVLMFIKPIARKYERVVRADQHRGAHLVETIQGIRTIKSLALEGRRRREWDVRIAENMDARFEMGKMGNYPPTLTLPFERLIYSGSFTLGAYLALTTPSTLNAGTLGAFAMLAMRVGTPLVQLARLQLDLAETRGAIQELATILNSPAEDSGENSGMKQPVEGNISFKDVRFRYSADAPYALDGVSFSIPQGAMIGVMGRSGSGKSTITRLLQRLHTNYEGLIKIDGMDLREINLAHLRTNVGIVLQENFLFRGSIRDNISMARPDATFAQIVRAAQSAGAEEFIERLPRGYDTLLEEGASNLSGGQRQRLAIARALLIDPKILLLDEATSALDAESEAIVNANLKKIAQGRTVISISHRLSMLVDADAIIVLERGKLYDMGTHDELLERCDIYKQLWHQQNRHIERTRGTPKGGPVAAIGQG